MGLANRAVNVGRVVVADVALRRGVDEFSEGRRAWKREEGRVTHEELDRVLGSEEPDAERVYGSVSPAFVCEEGEKEPAGDERGERGGRRRRRTRRTVEASGLVEEVEVVRVGLTTPEILWRWAPRSAGTRPDGKGRMQETHEVSDFEVRPEVAVVWRRRSEVRTPKTGEGREMRQTVVLPSVVTEEAERVILRDVLRMQFHEVQSRVPESLNGLGEFKHRQSEACDERVTRRGQLVVSSGELRKGRERTNHRPSSRPSL